MQPCLICHHLIAPQPWQGSFGSLYYALGLNVECVNATFALDEEDGVEAPEFPIPAEGSTFYIDYATGIRIWRMWCMRACINSSQVTTTTTEPSSHLSKPLYAACKSPVELEAAIHLFSATEPTF